MTIWHHSVFPRTGQRNAETLHWQKPVFLADLRKSLQGIVTVCYCCWYHRYAATGDFLPDPFADVSLLSQPSSTWISVRRSTTLFGSTPRNLPAKACFLGSHFCFLEKRKTPNTIYWYTVCLWWHDDVNCKSFSFKPSWRGTWISTMPPGDARRAATFLFRVRGRLDRVVGSFASMDLREPRQLNGSHLRDISSEEPWFVRKAWVKSIEWLVGRYILSSPLSLKQSTRLLVTTASQSS